MVWGARYGMRSFGIPILFISSGTKWSRKSFNNMQIRTFVDGQIGKSANKQSSNVSFCGIPIGLVGFSIKKHEYHAAVLDKTVLVRRLSFFVTPAGLSASLYPIHYPLRGLRRSNPRVLIP